MLEHINKNRMNLWRGPFWWNFIECCFCSVWLWICIINWSLLFFAAALAVPTLIVAVKVITQMMREAGLLATRTREWEVGGARKEEGTSLNSLNPFLPSTLPITCLTCLTRKWAPQNRFDRPPRHNIECLIRWILLINKFASNVLFSTAFYCALAIMVHCSCYEQL